MHTYILAAVMAASVAGATSVQCQTEPVSRAKPGTAAAPAASVAADAPAKGIGRGLMLGVSAIAAPGVSVEGPDIEGELSTKFSGGLGVQAGYGFSNGLMAFATLDVARQDSGIEGLDGSFGLASFEVGARYNLPMQSARVSPYVLAAVGARALGATVEDVNGKSDVSLTGAAFDVGGGVELPIARSLAVASEVRLGFGKFGKYKQDGETTDIDVDNTLSTRVRVGLSWYPGVR